MAGPGIDPTDDVTSPFVTIPAVSTCIALDNDNNNNKSK